MPIDCKFILLKHQALSSVHVPIRSTQRIKYTCFEVSQKYLLFGATSGGLYVFQRSPSVFLHLIPTKEGSISKIAISKDERFVAFASKRGSACVLEWDDDEDRSKLINRSLEHSGSIITEMIWSDKSNQLYIGDNTGRLSVINVSLCKSKNIFQLPAFVFMQLDSGIIQISCFENYLLVSTETWCYICDTTKEHYKQIGSKLREGDYGACFFNHNESLIIYSARPGSRLWEVNLNGTVLSTHQLKKVLAVQPTPTVDQISNKVIIENGRVWPEQPFNFCYLLNFLGKFLLTYKSDGIYIFDPIAVDVVLWTDHFYNIKSVKCVNDMVYVWTSLGELYSFSVLTLDKCLLQLYFENNYRLCFDVLELFMDDIKFPEEFKMLVPLIGLNDYIAHDNKKMCDFFKQLKRYKCDKPVATRLDSGIFLVENRHWKKWKISDNRTFYKTKRNPYRKSRSLPNCIHSVKCVENPPKIQKTVSLPDFHFALDHLSFQNSYVELNGSLTDDSGDSGTILPNIPFLSLASPELFHSTICELHHNVSGKFYIGTKSLKHKWENLEGKFKLLKVNTLTSDTSEDTDCNNWKEQTFNCNPTKSTKENGIVLPHMEPLKKNNTIDVSEILKKCNQVTNSNNSFNSIFQLFNLIVKKHRELHELNSSNSDVKRITPFTFNDLLPVACTQIIRQAFHKAINSTRIIEYLKNMNVSLTEYFEHTNHPELILKNHNAIDLTLDSRLSYILVVFSEIIDPFSILTSLEHLSVPCIFLSWCTVLDTFQESAFNYITSDKSGTCDYKSWPLPLLLNTIFLMFRLQQIESSYHLSSEAKLKFYHISYLILKLHSHFDSTGMSKDEVENVCNELLLKYISKLICNQNLNINDIFEYTVFPHIECAFLEFNQIKVPICTCNHVLFGNRKIDIKYNCVGKLMLYIYLIRYEQPNKSLKNGTLELFYDKAIGGCFLRLAIAKYIAEKSIHGEEEFSIEELVPGKVICEKFILNSKHSVIINLIQTMPELMSILMQLTARNVMEILPFIVQYGLFYDLNNLIISPNEKFWISVCDLNAKFSKGICCICSTVSSQSIDVDWSMIAVTMLKFLSTQKTLSIFKMYTQDIPANKIDIRFYRACILSKVISTHYPNKHSSLINDYCNKICCSVGIEVKQESSLLMMEDIPPYTPSIIHTKDSSNKWGIYVDINLDACGRCALLLNSKKLIQDGLRGFKCGHIYHIICLRLANSDFKCPVCSSN